MSGRRRSRHLYREGAEAAERRAFEREYGPRGDQVYGEVVGKVARERAAERGGEYTEHVRGHIAFSDRGTRFRIKGHTAEIHAHPHGRAHHGGRCDGSCRRAVRGHRHRRGRGSSAGG